MGGSASAVSRRCSRAGDPGSMATATGQSPLVRLSASVGARLASICDASQQPSALIESGESGESVRPALLADC